MGIGDFYIGGLPVIPTEDQAPLLIDSHAPGTLEIAIEGFEPIVGRDSQILQNLGRVNLLQPRKSQLLNFSRQSFGPTTVPDLLGFHS